MQPIKVALILCSCFFAYGVRMVGTRKVDPDLTRVGVYNCRHTGPIGLSTITCFGQTLQNIRMQSLEQW